MTEEPHKTPETPPNGSNPFQHVQELLKTVDFDNISIEQLESSEMQDVDLDSAWVIDGVLDYIKKAMTAQRETKTWEAAASGIELDPVVADPLAAAVPDPDAFKVEVRQILRDAGLDDTDPAAHRAYLSGVMSAWAVARMSFNGEFAHMKVPHHESSAGFLITMFSAWLMALSELAQVGDYARKPEGDESENTP